MVLSTERQSTRFFWLNYYIATCGALGVPLLGEYLFRSSEHKKFVSHRPFGEQLYLHGSKSILKPPAPSRVWDVLRS